MATDGVDNQHEPHLTHISSSSISSHTLTSDCEHPHPQHRQQQKATRRRRRHRSVSVSLMTILSTMILRTTCRNHAAAFQTGARAGKRSRNSLLVGHGTSSSISNQFLRHQSRVPASFASSAFVTQPFHQFGNHQTYATRSWSTSSSSSLTSLNASGKDHDDSTAVTTKDGKSININQTPKGGSCQGNGTSNSKSNSNSKSKLEYLIKNWRKHPSLDITLTFPTWLVPSASVQTILKDSELQQYLPYTAPNVDDVTNPISQVLQSVHPRIKIVQASDQKTHRRLLRSPTLSVDDPLPQPVLDTLARHGVTDGPVYTAHIPYYQLTFSYILTQLLPIPPPTSYEQIGHIAHFNLIPSLLVYGELIGQVLVDINPTIHTVVTKVGEVSGPHRTYPLKVLAGPTETRAIHIEHGLSVRLDVASCYWCTRLSGERQVLLQSFEPYDVVADVFCGVGTLPMLANRDKNCTVLANDWNPSAIKYFETNLEHNGLPAEDFFLNCGDGHEFLSTLGNPVFDDGIGGRARGSYGKFTTTKLARRDENDDWRPLRLPDHIVMNYPLEAPTFLTALRNWSKEAFDRHAEEHEKLPRFHVYTFARTSAREAPSESLTTAEEEVAVKLIAEQLVPGEHDDYRHELDYNYGCNVSTRAVRDVAPGKMVVCVSFTLTSPLLYNIQHGAHTR